VQTGALHETKVDDLLRTGVVTFFNEAKGFGFIKDFIDDFEMNN